MGFIETLSRMLRGKPAFIDPAYEEPKAGTQQFSPITNSLQTDKPTSGLVDAGGRKIIPELQITHVKSSVNGSQMTTTAWVTNPSTHRVRIDDILLLKQKTMSHRELGPGEGHEATLYHGPVAMNDHEHKAQIIYRLMENGDRFRADFFVKYTIEHDGSFVVDELHPEHPIHDV